MLTEALKLQPSNHNLPCETYKFEDAIVHFFTRLLVQTFHEDYYRQHDPEPINLDRSGRLCSPDRPHMIAMHERRLELTKLCQNMTSYIDLPTRHPERQASGRSEYLAKLRGLVADLDRLDALYVSAMRIYEWKNQETESSYRSQLASEQLEEAKQSMHTAISLGKFSNGAFLYLPLNFVCTPLGMNLKAFGQGSVSAWVFFALVLFFGLLTYLPVYKSLLSKNRSIQLNVALRLFVSWRSPVAAFWFLAFVFTHGDMPNFNLTHSGHSQVLLGNTIQMTRSLLREDTSLGESAFGNEDFWRRKVRIIYAALEEVDPPDEQTDRRV